MAKVSAKMVWEGNGNNFGWMDGWMDHSEIGHGVSWVISNLTLPEPPQKRYYSLASCASDTGIREPAEFTNAIGCCLSFSVIDIDMFPSLRVIHVHIMYIGNVI